MMQKENDWVAAALEGQPPIMTVTEAIGVIRITRRHLYRLVAAGRIHAVKQAEGGSGRLLVPKASIEKYLRGLEVKAGRAA